MTLALILIAHKGLGRYICMHSKRVNINKQSQSSLARQPLVGLGLLKKLCPFISVEGDSLPILDPCYSYILINTILPSQFWSSNTSYAIRFGVEYLFNRPIAVHTHQVPCPCQSFNFDVSNNVWFVKCFI